VPIDSAREDDAMRGVLGAVAAISAWLGWLTVCPALGFPTLAMAPMFNRVLVPADDPGSWLGWALLLIALGSVALVYLVAAARGLLRPGVASGLLYGAFLWLVAGAVVMPVLGLLFPAGAATTPGPLTPPDPMHGSFMMLHVGVGAPIAALVAWLTFGAVLGAAAASPADDLRTPRNLALGAGIAVATLLVVGFVGLRLSAAPAGASQTATRTLVTEQAQALPKGTDYFSVLELTQAPGGALGPHAHPYSGFAYSLKGVATLVFSEGQTARVSPGSVGFIATQAAHSHLNTDDRITSAVLALLIVALAAVVAVLVLRRDRRAERLIPPALVALIAVGALGALSPWSNDWVFLSVRGTAQRGGPMPLPTSSRVYESPDVGALSGRYTQTLEEITLAPRGGEANVGSAGAAVLLALDGRALVQPSGGSSIELGPRRATLLQPGTPVRLTNAGDTPARLLQLTVSPAPAGG
jgi:quercetin dioxygenase-like cupin family protein